MNPEKFTARIAFRGPVDLIPRLKAIAERKHTKYNHEARLALLNFVEQQEKDLHIEPAKPEMARSKRKKAA